MAELIIENLFKDYGTARVLDDINLHVKEGEFVSLLGPSGCGKSTTLGAIAGLDKPTSGKIAAGRTTYFDSTKGVFLHPEARNCGLVFQSYALWPHMTVLQNVMFPLSLRKVSHAEQERRALESLALVEMEALAKRYPHELSGGQQQRVALARTLVYRPAILLLDEPLSNLDAKLRDRARVWLGELRSKLRITTIYVTHDQVEALALSDRVVVMNSGRVSQVGTPREIYERPADPSVADFIGTTNFFPGQVVDFSGSDRTVTVRLPDGQFLKAVVDASPPATGAEVTLAYRPEQMNVSGSPNASEDASPIRFKVNTRSYVGGKWQLGLLLGNTPARIEVDEPPSTDEMLISLSRVGPILFQGAPA
jgi:iron(III) transport system ATP-binding protein